MSILPSPRFFASIALVVLCSAAVAEEGARFTSAPAVAAQNKRSLALAQAKAQYATALKAIQADVMRSGQLDEANHIAHIMENPDDPSAPPLTTLRGKAAQSAYKAAVQRANSDYLITLKAALATSLRDGQLDESNHIAAEIKSLEQATAASAAAAAVSPGFVNLLPLVDPQKHAVQGEWKIEKGALVSGGKGEERIEIPYEPPEEYDYQITFTKTGTNCVVQNCVAAGLPFIWVMSSSGSFTFHYLKGAGIGANKTTVKESSGISDRRRYVSLVKVRKTGAEAYLNGKLITKWQTDFSDLAPAGFWALHNRRFLGIGAGDTKVTIQAIEVKEVTGTGVKK
jgi:hypothetical protein